MISSIHQGREDLGPLRDALHAEAAEVGRALLGEPNIAVSTKVELRWGAKGALSLRIGGPRRGLWTDWDGEARGDLLGLIQYVQGCSFPKAVSWARDFVKVGPVGTPASARRPTPERKAEQEAAEAAERTRQHAEALGISRGGQPIAENTPGDWYLRQVRGIPRPAAGWPSCLKWHPGHRAILAIATAGDGMVQAVQRIHLAADGSKVTPEEVAQRKLRAVKVTNGRRGGAVVRLPGDPTGPLLVAEGPETALAAHVATGHETWIALGGMGGIELPAGRRIVVCADDDPPAHLAGKGAGAKALTKAGAAWRARGVDFVVALPWARRRYDKSDMADLILAAGSVAVRARVMAALGTDGGYTPPPRVPVEEARRQVDGAVVTFFGRVDSGSTALVAAGKDAPQPEAFAHAVRVDVGVGKSFTARLRMVETIAAMRARGDKRTLVLAVPTHVLGAEQAAAFLELPEARRIGLRVEVWRGRAAPDPARAKPDGAGPTMCGDLDRVRDVQSLGLSVQDAACKGRVKEGGKSRTVTCPFYEQCAYQAQQARRADVWIVAHEMLFTAAPKAIGTVAGVVVDEAAWSKGLVGAEGKPITLALDALRGDCAVYGKGGYVDRQGGYELEHLRGRLLAALERAADGPLRQDLFQGSSLTVATTHAAGKLEWARKVEAIHPGQTREERKAAMAAAEGNRTIKRATMVWHALGALLAEDGPEASGWVELGQEQTRTGPVKVLRLKGRGEVAAGWQAPTMLLDALLPIDLVRHFWPAAELVADVRATMPHQHVRQVVDRTYAKSMLEPLAETEGSSSAEGQRRKNRLRDLRDVLVREARRYAPSRVLVVAQQAIEDGLRVLGGLPGTVELAHHNAVAGRDEWRDVAALIVIGRTQPATYGAERIAEALTGKALAPAERYERRDAVREMVDGSLMPAEADRHPHPLAEVIRWQIAEGELVQIIGRARGVNRTAADPVDVLVMTDVPLPVALAGTMQAADLEPSMVDRMLGEGGISMENPGDAATVYPALWPSRNAAKLAFKRGKLGSFPIEESIYGKRPQLRRIEYQPKGQGKSKAEAWFDPLLCPDPREFLTARLGELAWSRFEGEPKPEPPEPAKRGRKRTMPAGEGPDAWDTPLPDMAPECGPAPSPWDAVLPVDGIEAGPVLTGQGTIMDREAAMHDAGQGIGQEQAGLEPGVILRAGLWLGPHPAFPPYDALPVEGAWQITRKDLPTVTVMQVRSPFRVISNRPDVEAVQPPSWVRVHGPDGMVEPVGMVSKPAKSGLMAAYLAHAGAPGGQTVSGQVNGGRIDS